MLKGMKKPLICCAAFVVCLLVATHASLAFTNEPAIGESLPSFKEAFRVNKLYRTIQKRKDLKDKIKMIGIGTGNTPFEVGFFQKKYEVPFPLFPDENLSIHRILGELRTPYFLGVKIDSDGSNKVFYSRLGQFRDIDSFLKRIVELSGL